MGTATSRAVAAGLGLLALASAGCGAGAPARTSSAPSSAPAGKRARQSGVSFAWLAPRPAPANWQTAKIATGAAFAYPRGWRRYPGDAGTATAVMLGPRGKIRGYLNLTPRQGEETLGTWASFRVRHNAEEGDREVRSEGVAEGLRFRDGRGSCVRDRYMTVTGARYIELACLVVGANASSVIVAAATPRSWPSLSPVLQRAISAVTT